MIHNNTTNNTLVFISNVMNSLASLQNEIPPLKWTTIKQPKRFNGQHHRPLLSGRHSSASCESWEDDRSLSIQVKSACFCWTLSYRLLLWLTMQFSIQNWLHKCSATAKLMISLKNNNRNGNTQGESSWTWSHHDESFKDKPRWLKLMQSFQEKQTDTKIIQIRQTLRKKTSKI